MEVTEVYICGQKYRLRTDQERHTVEEIALYVSDKMKEVEDSLNVLTTYKVAVITAFNIATEYLSLKNEMEGSHELIKFLNSKIVSS